MKYKLYDEKNKLINIFNSYEDLVLFLLKLLKYDLIVELK